MQEAPKIKCVVCGRVYKKSKDTPGPICGSFSCKELYDDDPDRYAKPPGK